MSWCWRVVICRGCGREHCLICGVNRRFAEDTEFKITRKWLYDKVSLEMWTLYFPSISRNHLARLHHVTVCNRWRHHLFLYLFKNGLDHWFVPRLFRWLFGFSCISHNSAADGRAPAPKSLSSVQWQEICTKSKTLSQHVGALGRWLWVIWTELSQPLVRNYLLLLVFSPWDGLGRDQSSVRRLVWLWYAAYWASS